MAMTFKIGRNPDNNYIIEHPTVSGFHAQIEVEDNGEWTIRDMDSANGVLINDKDVMVKKIKPEDKIQLGKFVINNQELISKIQELKKNNQLDFSQEFNVIKEYYDEYNAKASKLKSTYKIKPLIIRGGITLAMMLVIFLLPVKIDSSLRSTLMVVVGIAGGTIATLMVNDNKLKNQLDLLYVQFSKKIRCPKCNFELINKSWIYWKEKGECPKCNCSWKE